MSKIIWSKIDEAPALATYSLLPIVNAFTKAAGVEVVTSDISLAGRVISKFSDRLKPEQRINDELAELGNVVLQPDGNIIKLPNISASVGQLIECITELQAQGYDVPNYPEDAKTDEEKALKEIYSTCLGSAVNPVLREGNSDRRAAAAVKRFAQKNPHKLRAFESPSKAYVAHMNGGDFFSNEKSVIVEGNAPVTIELNGKVLKTLNDVVDKEIMDATFMSAKALQAFYQKTLDDAKKNGVLWSLHLKATMMKVSDPIMFGHAVKVFFKDVFAKYGDELTAIGYNANMGLGDLYKKLEKSSKKAEIIAAIEATYDIQPPMAMVDSDKGITNLHASNDIIIDASMPVVVRDGGKMWNRDGKVQECVSVIPDASYAFFHKAMVDDCVANGQYDVTTMGNVANVGLMAQKAEEYGSHPTTFEIAENGSVEVKQNGKVLMSHNVEAGDIWRMSRVKDIPIQDWVRLAVERARLTGSPAVFWLDKNRAHDANMIKKVNEYLKNHDTTGLELPIMDVASAAKYTNARVRKGEDTISVTGNVLRDHLTDMYPILELGTSAKMLSIVPLLAGGGVFETGAGGSAPKHVDQFLEEGHLRWDSLGEFLALAESLRFIAQKNSDDKLAAVTTALDIANAAYLDNNKAPSRKAGEPDNKASHFFLAQYWAKALSEGKNAELAAKFAPIAKALTENEAKIIEELLSIEGKAQDIGGYYHPDDKKAEAAMRPSATLNKIVDSI
ncbi:Isocitrate dehydrogenase (NADP+) [Sulfurimonas denitrificans DSM 1251]|uniref:Isocitrate dehydrogenase [NADP] n=1 Tax=Sulfurimonas denitrificans (strain ATCC 33889 / DSM 1251) TaxID=326298 RepID=Q30RQ6_SULDN|nr:NADP-dependent isocitrate dehydrogenase [Sulfurimonas denitrificans]ABB44325.1 Isocitrate dehydrogenase (NADP+) [Sulfurimonas denitrificans DSM 1251]MDD3441981.1 NADP-dependent isocitrate dehydrogenase [Sulfurimonas denitrificans]